MYISVRFIKIVESVITVLYIYYVFAIGFETKTDVYIAMEYLPGGELFDYISDKGGLREDQARKLFSGIASAVAFCHKVNTQNSYNGRYISLDLKCMI